MEIIHNRLKPDVGWQTNELRTAKRLLDRGVTPALAAAIMQSVAESPFWSGKVRSALDLERHLTQLQAELSRSKDGKLEEKPIGPAYKPYSGPAELAPRDWDTEALTNPQIARIRAKIREIRARGVPWPKVFGEMSGGGGSLESLLKKADDEDAHPDPRRKLRET